MYKESFCARLSNQSLMPISEWKTRLWGCSNMGKKTTRVSWIQIKRERAWYTKEESHRPNFKIVKLSSRQKGNVQHTSGWIIYRVVRHQEKPRNNLISLKSCSLHIVWNRHQHRVCFFVGLNRNVDEYLPVLNAYLYNFRCIRFFWR